MPSDEINPRRIEWRTQYDKEKRSVKYQCECGSPYTIQHKTRHEKTKKHQKYCEKVASEGGSK